DWTGWRRRPGPRCDRPGRAAADRLSLPLCLRDADRNCHHPHCLHVHGRAAAMNVTNAPLLSLITFLPLVGVAFIAFLPRDAVQNARYIALWTTLVTFAVSLLVWINFDTSTADFQFVEEHPWLGPIVYRMGVDGI